MLSQDAFAVAACLELDELELDELELDELELDELEPEELLELDDVSLLFFSVELELEESADGLVLGFVSFLPERESVR